MIQTSNNIVTMTIEDLHELYGEIELRENVVKALDAQLKEANEVIEFYGDKEMWGKSNQNHFNRCVYTDCNIVKSHQYKGVWYNNSMVGGKRARQYSTKYKIKE